MKPIALTSKVDAAAAALREEIANGRWEERLPGARVLAEHLKVSPPTMAAALARLVTEGLISSSGERRSFRVVSQNRRKKQTVPEPSRKRLLILTHEVQDQLTETSRNILQRLREQMAARQWKVESQVVDFLHVKNPQRAWNQSIQVDSGTSVIALYGSFALAQWAIRSKVRIFFLGGVTNGLPVPMAAVRSSTMAEAALAKLTGLGHWRIVLPLCDRAESFNQRIREVTKTAIEATGKPYIRNYHNPETDYLKPDVTWRIVESAFALDPPTAFVLLDWKELVTVHCFISRRGLRVPEDVSLVLLNDQMEAAWFHPGLARFRFPEKRLVQAMVRWLEEGDDGGNLSISPPADFIEGGTIAPAKA